jgi:hypothetical protein
MGITGEEQRDNLKEDHGEGGWCMRGGVGINMNDSQGHGRSDLRTEEQPSRASGHEAEQTRYGNRVLFEMEDLEPPPDPKRRDMHGEKGEIHTGGLSQGRLAQEGKWPFVQ